MIGLKYLLIGQIFIVIASCDPLLFETKSGLVRCINESSFITNRTYIACKGIKYAKAPIDYRRFQIPYPIDKWTGVFNATQYGNCCYAMAQGSFSPANTIQSEDCLNLNIFIPVLKKKCALATLFFIYGGGFSVGDNTDYSNGAGILMERDNMILVTINYRMGPFGFANFEEKGYTGNMGVKDLKCGLHWIKKNIAYFGGDPNLITVTGQSSGGVLAHALGLNCDSRDHLNGILCMSGNAFSPFGFVTGNNQVQLLRDTYQLANASNQEVLLYMKNNLTAIEIAQRTPVFESFPFLRFYWALVIENITLALEPILTETPRQIYKNDNCQKSLSLIKGFFGDTSAENLLFTNANYPNYGIDLMNENLYVGFPVIGLTLSPTSNLSMKLQNDIFNQYFGTLPPINNTLDNINRYNQLFSDILFCYSSFRAMEEHSAKADTYCYRNDVYSRLNLARIKNNLEQYYGTAHGEDMFYMFWARQYSWDYNDALQNETAVNIMGYETKLYASFVATGQPSNYLPINQTNYCIRITNSGLDSLVGPRTDIMEFWNGIVDELQPYIAGGF